MMSQHALLQKLHPRHIRWWQWLLFTFVGFLLFFRSWFPGFVRQQVLTQLATVTPAHIQLRDVDLDLLHGQVTLQQLSFLLDGDTQPALAIHDFSAKVSLSALLRREINIVDITLNGVQFHVIKDANGQVNLSRLFPPSTAELEQSPSDLPTLLVQRVRIANSQCTYRDRAVTPEAHFTFAVTMLQANQVALQANGLVAPVDVQLQGTLNNGPVNGKANVLWQREQTAIEATVEAKQIALAVIEPYLHDVLTVRRLTGQLGARIEYLYKHTLGVEFPRHSLTGTLNVNNLQFVELGSEQAAFVLPDGQFTIETLNLTSRNLSLRSIELKDPKLVLVQRDKGLNVISWVRTSQTDSNSSSAQTQNSPAWQFSVSTIKWIGGELDYRDNAWPEKDKLTLHPEEIVAKGLKSNVTELPFQFRTRMGDGKVAGEGTIWFALPQKQDGEAGAVATLLATGSQPVIRRKVWPFAKLQIALQASNLDVTPLQPLLTPVLATKQVQGKLAGDFSTVLFERDDSRAVNIHGAVEATNFSISDTPEHGNTLSWQEGKIVIPDGSSVMPLALSIESNVSRVVLRRPEQKDLAIEKVIGQVRVANATLVEGGEHTAITGTFETTKFSLRGLPEATNVLAWDSGHLEFQEGSTLIPLALKLKTQMSQLSLRQLPQGDVTIEKASSELQLVQETDALQPSILKAHGPIEITSFSLTQGEEKQVLLGCYRGKAIMSEGSRLLPLDIKLRDVALEYTYAQGMRPPSGQFQLFIPTEQKPDEHMPTPVREGSEATTASVTTVSDTTLHPPPSVATPTEVSAPTVSIQLDRATIIGGQLYFEDRTVTPPQTVYWQDVRVELNRAGYPILLPAAFSAHAYNEDGAPVEFKGTTERKGGQSVVRVHGKVEKMLLSRFNSYLEPSLGYRVKKGAVTATWDLVIPGDRLQANMQVALHDIGLSGRPRSSTLEQQVGLPLTLVIALLKDLNGDINLQLPVEGRMNDPGVQWSGTVLRAVRDVLIGAAASPLKVLGALFQGKDKLEGFTLEPIRFVVGTNQIAKEGREQLSRLALFLAQRPKIDLRLSGITGTEDSETLRTQEMLKQLPEAPPVAEKTESPPPITPQDEVRKFLAERPAGQGGASVATLFPQANELFAQLSKRTKLPATVIEQLANERVQAVITELTTHHAVAVDRLKMSPEKQRGTGSAEVRYTIQTREE